MWQSAPAVRRHGLGRGALWSAYLVRCPDGFEEAEGGGTFRPIAVRAAQAYKTVSCTAPSVLASIPPLELIAREYAEAYRAVRSLRERGVVVTVTIRTKIRLQLR